MGLGPSSFSANYDANWSAADRRFDEKLLSQNILLILFYNFLENVKFLKSVPLLQNLDNNTLSKIGDVLELVSGLL